MAGREAASGDRSAPRGVGRGGPPRRARATRAGQARPARARVTERPSMNRYGITRAPARHDEGVHMHLLRRKLRLAAVAAVAAVALAAAGCGSSGSNSTSGNGVSLNNGLQGLNPGTGAAKRGGTLNLLGTGGVDFMDYNISYYTIGYLGQRMWVRGLYAYPAIPGQTTTPAPDLATAPPVVSNGGLTYTVTIRSGAQWNTTPATPVTAADAPLRPET